jgi:hypothetical protein
VIPEALPCPYPKCRSINVEFDPDIVGVSCHDCLLSGPCFGKQGFDSDEAEMAAAIDAWNLLPRGGLQILCDSCGELLEEPGALLFGPPNALGDSAKRHICKTCVLSKYDLKKR